MGQLDALAMLFGVPNERTFQRARIRPANPIEAPTGIEPVSTALQAAA
jgi:hypothetical protein